MEIGPKPFIIAEMSANHGGDIQKAKMLISAARECGCDAVKIQTYELKDLPEPDPANILTPKEWFPELFGVAREIGITLFSSVFAPWAVEELEKYNCPAYKLASPESTRLPHYSELVGAIKKTGKTFIASSGRKDFKTVSDFKPDHMLYCLAGYPAKMERTDLFMMDFADGFSDHTAGLKEPISMLWFGAKVIEKHFKLDDNCIDAAFSLNPQQMKLLCDIAHQ